VAVTAEVQTDDAYRMYRGVLVGSLGRLARAGYVTPSVDGLEFVHDFFLEAWPDVVASFDPARGTAFKTYLQGAFVRFARPRIIRANRWREVLLERDAAAEDAVESLGDQALLRRAFARLPPLDRQLLSERIVDHRSERQLASRLGLSRYRTREAIVNALGRLAVALNEPGVIGSSEWPLALALWRDEFSLKEAAAQLGMSEAQAVRLNARLRSALETALQGSGEVSREQYVNPLCEVWRRAALEGDIAALKGKVEDVLDHLESNCQACDGVSESSEPEKLARLYLKLADEDPDPLDQAALERMLEARANDESAVVRAVQEVLLPRLGDGFAPPRELTGPGSALKLFLALDAFSMFVHRLFRGRTDDPRFVLSNGAIVQAGRQLIAAEDVASEISHVAELPLRTSAALAQQWLPRALQKVPRLVPGIEATSQGRSVELRLGRRDPDEDLSLRWKPETLRILAAASSG
jgi:RNA polymerase sigma factor (sigma-70 family)